MAPAGIGGWFDEFTGIYAALAQVGVDPRRADDLEIWEVAAMMGLHTQDDADAAAPSGSPPPRDLIAERLAHARGDGPKPEPDRPAAVDPEVTNLIRRIP